MGEIYIFYKRHTFITLISSPETERSKNRNIDYFLYKILCIIKNKHFFSFILIESNKYGGKYVYTNRSIKTGRYGF